MSGPGEGRPAAVLVADSFLVADGRVRGPALHRERFTRSCARHGVDAGAFFDAWVAGLPREGRWFPRCELRADGAPHSFALHSLLRPAPPQGGPMRVMVYDGPDPRREPWTKGPDLERLGELRSAAVAAGADEALLTAADGTVLEAAYMSLLWWEDDILCVPPADLPVLPSVTVALLRTIAARRGITVAERRRTLPELAGREAWLVNALHGIRPVRSWLPPGPPAGGAVKASDWQRELRDLAQPLPGR
ncbi:MAG TPA: aminotransferase class IV [Kribbellaceae bacterium]